MMEKKKGLLNLASTKTALSIPHHVKVDTSLYIYSSMHFQGSGIPSIGAR